MLSSTLTRYHRRIDERPGPYVLGRNFVSRSGETALVTEKIVPRGEGESEDDFNKRVKEEMEEGNKESRDEAASNAEVDLSIE